jgi:hypothetical protein
MRGIAIALVISFTPAVSEAFLPEAEKLCPQKFVLVTCDENAARVCQLLARGCVNVLCKASDKPERCRQECLDRYKVCRVDAGCDDS